MCPKFEYLILEIQELVKNFDDEYDSLELDSSRLTF